MPGKSPKNDLECRRPDRRQ